MDSTRREIEEAEESQRHPFPSEMSLWTVDDVCRWLDTLQLGEYKQAFREGKVRETRLGCGTLVHVRFGVRGGGCRTWKTTMTISISSPFEWEAVTRKMINCRCFPQEPTTVDIFPPRTIAPKERQAHMPIFNLISTHFPRVESTYLADPHVHRRPRCRWALFSLVPMLIPFLIPPGRARRLAPACSSRRIAFKLTPTVRTNHNSGHNNHRATGQTMSIPTLCLLPPHSLCCEQHTSRARRILCV